MAGETVEVEREFLLRLLKHAAEVAGLSVQDWNRAIDLENELLG